MHNGEHAGSILRELSENQKNCIPIPHRYVQYLSMICIAHTSGGVRMPTLAMSIVDAELFCAHAELTIGIEANMQQSLIT